MSFSKEFLLLFIFYPVTLFGEAHEPTTVLFVGNSFTQFHNLPEIVAQMAHSKGKRLYYEKVVEGGASFESHWKDGKALAAIKSKDWDIVVLQEQSFKPVSDSENMHDYGKRFGQAVSATNARPYFYLTWAYESKAVFSEKRPPNNVRFEHMQNRLTEAYFGLARGVGAKVSPVGLAWEIVQKEHPELRLHAPDGSHPGPLGAYLSGLVMYSALFDEPAESMPETLYPYFRLRSKQFFNGKLTVTTEQRKILESAAKHAIEKCDARMNERDPEQKP